MTVYLDTSVILSRFLGQANRLTRWGGWDRVHTSVLTRVEYFRTLDRLRLQGRIDDEARVALQGRFDSLWRATYRVRLSPTVLLRAAGPFPTVLGALDALHLSCALASRDATLGEFLLLTHDRQLARAARALDLAVDGV